MNSSPGLAKANEFVQFYARKNGVRNAILDDNNDAAFGSFGFKYDSNRQILFGRAYIGKAVIKGASQEWINNARKMTLTLNNPSIGGMFENGGAIFILDEEKEAYFMVRAFPMASLTSRLLMKQMDELQSLAAVWSISWLFHVARIMHGHEPAPTVRVTRKNNPYR